MIYLSIAGRMGNQMFQYAFARRVQEFVGGDLVIDFTHYSGVDGYEDALKYFNTKKYICAVGNEMPFYISILFKIVYKLKPKNLYAKYVFEMVTTPLLSYMGIYYIDSDYKKISINLHKRKNVFIKGWFESPSYFFQIDEIIKKEFEPRIVLSEITKCLIKKLQTNNSVCLSVRVGFLVNEKLKDVYGVCDISYYKKALAFIQDRIPDVLIYVCSDDIEWCKKHLQLKGNIIFECSNLNVWEKMTIMKSCKNFIISNSTFSWWAQHLSTERNKIVIAPRVWRNEHPTPIAIKETNWIYID